MNTPRWILPLAVLLGANIVPLTNVARDRIGPPRYAAEFTERELPLDYSRDGNTGKSVYWSWGDGAGLDSVDREGMTALGFPCVDVADRCWSAQRSGWAIVMIDSLRTPSWILQQRARVDSLRRRAASDTSEVRTFKAAEENLQEQERTTSHLRARKAGTDRAALEAERREGELVLAVSINAYRITAGHDSLPQWWRLDLSAMPRGLHIPSEVVPAFDSLTPSGPYAPEGRVPRYRVVVAVGGRGLARVEAVRPIE